MKNLQGIPTTRLTLGGEVMVPRGNRTLLFSTELLNYIIPFAAQRKIGHHMFVYMFVVFTCPIFFIALSQ